MKILIAPAAMKGTLNSIEAANAIEEGLRIAGHHNFVKLPIADGGDDTAQLLASKFNAKFITAVVSDPLGRPISSGYYLNNEGIAIIEMAAVSGLRLLKPEEYSALHTTSYGTGQLIKLAIEQGAIKIILGVGGSATVDAGMGALMALGYRFFDGREIIHHGSGANTGKVIGIEKPSENEFFQKTEIVILCDVTNPILGINGSANVFAPQKGASSNEVKILNKNLSLFTGVLYQETGVNLADMKGGGAAGGIAASFNALLGAKIVNGADFVLKTLGFYDAAKECDIIITGEGRIDESSFQGKATGEVFNFGTKIDKQVYVVCGLSDFKNKMRNIKIFPVVDDKTSLSDSMNNAYNNLVNKAVEIGNYINAKEERKNS